MMGADGMFELAPIKRCHVSLFSVPAVSIAVAYVSKAPHRSGRGVFWLGQAI